MAENSSDVGRFPSHNDGGQKKSDARDITNKDILEHLQKMGKRLNTLEKRYKEERENKEKVPATGDRKVRAGSIHVIFSGPYLGGTSWNARDNYAREARGNPLTNVFHLSERPPKLFK